MHNGKCTHLTRFFPPWRAVDLVVAAVLGVATGVVFTAWNAVYAPLSIPLGAITPGLVALLDGVWLVGGLLVGLIIRRPGAALFGELLASLVSAAIGNQWGFSVLLLGIVQGLAIEVGLLLWAYRGSLWGAAVTAGAIGGVVQGFLEVAYWYPGTDSTFVSIYVSSATASGALLGAGLSAGLVTVLARTGVLANFGR